MRASKAKVGDTVYHKTTGLPYRVMGHAQGRRLVICADFVKRGEPSDNPVWTAEKAKDFASANG